MFAIFAPRVIVCAVLTEKNVQGFKLGSPQNLTDVSHEKTAAARRKQAKEHIPNIRAIGSLAGTLQSLNKTATIALDMGKNLSKK